MLVLMRRDGEDIEIGEDIRIHIVEAKTGRVTIGITAPDDVRIRRPREG